jgi:hypothetical protein
MVGSDWEDIANNSSKDGTVLDITNQDMYIF